MSLPITSFFLRWNRKLHLYLGLYFLVFLWLFAVSGLLLNHTWSFAEFWSQRRQSTTDHSITRPVGGTDLDRAQDLMQQLALAGEVEWTTTPSRPDRFDFRIVRPGRILEVKADFRDLKAVVNETRVNGWGILRSLHTFTGVRSASAGEERDWWLTYIWSFSMDAVAFGLILLVISSLVMACEQRSRGIPAGLALGLGLLVCAFFVFGLRRL
jgi:hypothetical protein